HYDIIAIQEPYIDFLGCTHAGLQWSPVYPPGHRDFPKLTRSVLFVNTAISTNSWTQLPVNCPDITAIQITCGDCNIHIYNIYNDCTHSTWSP
ncbi:hypothetical protein K439DRAFT_1357007, partial [Ramaria rubella]